MAQTEPTKVTPGAIAGSRRVYSAPPCRPDIAVPFREVALHPSANEPPVRLYDTSGPYTDPQRRIDLNEGAPKTRAGWIAARGFRSVPGRSVRPEDNGFAAMEQLVPPCPAGHAVLAGQAGAPVTQYEFARAGIIT